MSASNNIMKLLCANIKRRKTSSAKLPKRKCRPGYHSSQNNEKDQPKGVQKVLFIVEES